ncbi:MAG: lytic transglycosylase domain-containing protein [Thermodesulfovibrionales bacterium]|nr:lytic transglycosylase domain-containing protein [Thermodesulfovibrionales bacterium]
MNLSFFFSVLAVFSLLSPTVTLASEDKPETISEELISCLIAGKKNLDSGNYNPAIESLTKAYEKTSILSDYILFWRAQAYEKEDYADNALSDLMTIKEKYKNSPLIKNVRIKEIELLEKKNEPNIIKLYEGFAKEYPSEYPIKYAYAIHLKKNKETEQAKKLFKEIFISSSPLSKNAMAELSPGDITTNDLIKRGDTLNKAWLFVEAEKVFKEALQQLHKSEIKNQNSKLKAQNSELKTQALEGLAYSMFRQKRYKESSELYAKISNSYWHARALLRAKSPDLIESKLSSFMNANDKRIASVLIAYGTMKRRDNDIDGALKIFNELLVKHPSEKENILWAMGWTNYLSQDYKKASEIFSKLYEMNNDSKYLYWKNKCAEILNEAKFTRASSKKHVPYHDFYAFLSSLKEEQKLPVLEKTASQPASQELLSSLSPMPERINILTRLGLKQEAALELKLLSGDKLNYERIAFLSSHLNSLGSYKMSISLISKIPYNGDLHSLFYPIAFLPEVMEASEKNEMDHLLILSVMREESRFDPEAKSIAGAMGLMQLMPHTARRFDRQIEIRIDNDLYDARKNILIGSSYLKHLLKTFNSIPVAIAAYNAGEDAVKDWIKNGNYKTVDEFIEDIPYDETRNYVKKVLTSYFEYIRADRDADISTPQKYIGNL